MHYQANQGSPVFSELRAIVEKTVALAEPIRKALRPLSADIVAAFVYGSIASRKDTAQSDVDLMIVSDKLSYGELFAALEPVSQKLGRKINPTVYNRHRFAAQRQRSAFVRKVLDRPKIFIVGSESDIAA